ncbi:hypothetical protein C8R46DRAFT_862706, partial [Mycena filopes]
HLKLHRERLQRSAGVFADMFRIPQPPPCQDEQVDGCASVVLVGDAVADWEVALEWVYGEGEFQTQTTTTFDRVAGALRIATKYEMDGLREWAVRELLERWPQDVVDMRLNALPHAAEAIALAHECALPEILPACFYALSVQKWAAGADGGRSHLVLARDDMRRLIAGREALQDLLVRILVAPLAEPGCNSYFIKTDTADECCARWREEYWRTRLAPDAGAPYGTWLARELQGMLRDEAFVGTLCDDCARAHLGLVRWRLGRLRGAIPGFFLL